MTKSMTGAIDLTNPRHADALNAILLAGVFEVRDGKVTINFYQGHVQNITVEERRYQHVGVPKSSHVPI